MKKQQNQQTFAKFVKRLLSQNSHLFPYLSYLAQTKQQKVYRLMKDKSAEMPIQKTSIQQYLSLILFPKFTSLIWLAIVFISYMYYIVQMGIVLTYWQPAWQDELHSIPIILADAFTILVFMFDMFFNLNCGYLFKGMIISDRKRIVARYLRNYLFIDVINIFILLICPFSQVIWTNWFKLWLIFKLPRISQIDDFYLRRLNVHRFTKSIYVIFKMIILIFVLSHIVGLIFYAIDYQFLSSGYYPPSFCWLISSTAYSPIIELGWPLQYMYTLYWGVNTITTISYGDIAPLNPIQTNYSIAMFCFGFIVYGYVVNQIVKIILWARQHKDDFRNQMIIIDTYMQEMKTSPELKEQIRNYLQFLHKDQLNRDIEIQSQLKAKLPQDLRIQLLKSAYSVYYKKIFTIFQNPSSIRLLFHLTQRKYTSDETVFDQNQISHSLFYLHKGLIELRIKLGSQQYFLYQTNISNQFIGHYELFNQQPWRYKCVSKKGSLMYIIEADKMMEQIQSNPGLREKYKLIEYELTHKKNYSKIFYFCYFCLNQHDFKDCKEKFPTFSKQYSLDIESKQKKERFFKPKLNALTIAKEFRQIEDMRNSLNKKLLIKVQKRLAKIKKKIEQKNKDIQIDIAHDWTIYQPQWNLSKLQQQWNSKII